MKNNWYNNFSMFKWNDEEGNSFTCKRPEEFECDELESLAIALIWESSLDFEVSGWDGSAGNYDAYTPLFNMNKGKEYLIYYSDAKRWREGEEVTIYGKTPNKEEMAEINTFMESEGGW